MAHTFGEQELADYLFDRIIVNCPTCLALTIERLYRVRYLHRGTHPVRPAIDLLLLLQLSLGGPLPTVTDSS